MERFYSLLIDYVDGKELEINRYYACDSGEIYDEVLGCYLDYKPRNDGYCTIMLYLNSGIKAQFYVHRVIAATLIDNKLKYCNNLVVNHLNPEFKHDNSVYNLEVCTQKENIAYAIEMGRFKTQGEDNPTANLSNDTVHRICQMMEDEPNRTYISIAKELGVDEYVGILDTIGKIRQGKEWIHISSQYNLQRRLCPQKGVRVTNSYFDDYIRNEVKEIILNNPEIKPMQIAKMISIDLTDNKKKNAFTKMVDRMKKKLL